MSTPGGPATDHPVDTEAAERAEAVLAAQVAAEQERIDTFYGLLDASRARIETDLERTRRTPTAGTPAARAERDAFDAMFTERLTQLQAVEDRLCFGRLDLTDGVRRYVGRIGLADDAGEQVLIDWRADAAAVFYQATAAAPGDVARRRHITIAERIVQALEDEVLDLDALAAGDVDSLAGDGALVAALNAHRTGRMRDIVATIQAQQDEIIRAPLGGVLVVQGGPGTGKTAVALHRAAYLLYTHRERIAKSGVLLVGPNRVFLRYIEQVLPSLGETGVVTATPGSLFPGVTATVEDPATTAAAKGDLAMVDVLRQAVRSRQRIPRGPVELDVDGTTITLRPRDVEAARAQARRSRKPHNQARVVFVKELLSRLARSLAERLRMDADPDQLALLTADLRDSRDVRREVNLCWMPLTPEGLLRELYADQRTLRSSTRGTGIDPGALRRERSAPWTISDVPLLDELAELLGVDDSGARLAASRAAAERRQEVEYAKGVLSMSGDAASMMTADSLVDRYSTGGPSLSVADRAEADREWAFGHVVVDEAQELSPMMWRLLMRRCPSRSMTVVGDTAQTGSAAGTDSWGAALDPFVEGRWRLAELTVNYRTPRQVMDLASGLLAATGHETRAPDSARDAAWEPTARRAESPDRLVDAVVEEVGQELTLLGPGRLAVLTTGARADAVRGRLRSEFGAETVAVDEDTDAPVAVMSVTAAKGLEFDAVVLVEPAEVLAESARGVNNLYVALTRPTQRLRIVHAAALPPGLDEVAPA